MRKLQSIADTELTNYVVELLNKHNIITVQDFLVADVTEIGKKSNLTAACVQQLQKKLRELHGPPRFNYLAYTKTLNTRLQVYKFGIESLDELLESQHCAFDNNSIYEIFGLSGMGKTRFCHTVVLNIVRHSKVDALYIDTKQDFSGSCLYQIMRARNMPTIECGEIMQRIKVERTQSLLGVYDVLKELEKSLQADAEIVANIKFIIIDSLPAVWFTLNNEEESLERKYLLCRIANLLRKLAKSYNRATLLVNLALQEDEVLMENADAASEFELNAQLRQSPIDYNAIDLLLKPALGRYWAAIPNVRLCLKMPEDVDEYATERLIEITRSSYGPVGGTCRVNMTDAGVIGSSLQS